MILLELFLGFLKVGLFSFGGAYGAIPLIRDVVLSYGWLSDDALRYMIAVSESTPGPIMVNLATYVGSNQAGIIGAAVATLAVVLPAFLIIILVITALNRLIANPRVQAVMNALSACVVGVVLATGIFMTVQSCMGSGADLRGIAITGILIAILALTGKFTKYKLSPIHLILAGAALGAVIYGF